MNFLFENFFFKKNHYLIAYFRKKKLKELDKRPKLNKFETYRTQLNKSEVIRLK